MTLSNPIQTRLRELVKAARLELLDSDQGRIMLAVVPVPMLKTLTPAELKNFQNLLTASIHGAVVKSLTEVISGTDGKS